MGQIMTHFTWQSSILFDSLIKLRFIHGKVVALAPLIESQRGDLLLIDFIDRPLAKEHLIDLFGEAKPEIASDLKRFLTWWNEPPAELDGALRAGVALYWLHVIEPFEENNSEIAREICELALAQDEKIPERLYDFAKELRLNAEAYDQVLRRTMGANGDITDFLNFFLQILFKALEKPLSLTAESIDAFRFWKMKSDVHVNQRQKKLLSALASGNIDFISNKSYVEMFRVSRESAKRDLAELKTMKLISCGSTKGRAVKYTIIR